VLGIPFAVGNLYPWFILLVSFASAIRICPAVKSIP
jgi:hypothetical protein